MKALKNNLLFLSYIWKSDKWRIPLAVTVSLLQSFVSLLLEIYMIKYILDSFQIGRSFKDVLVVLTIMIGSALLSFLFADWYNNIYVPISNNKIRTYIDLKLFQKAKSVDLSCYDDSNFYNTYVRAMDSAEKKVLDVLNILVSIGTSVIVLISLLAIITVMDPVLLVFSVMPVLFSLPLSMIRNKFNYKMENDLVLDNRKVNYVKKIYYEKNYAKDLRMTKIGNVLSDRFRQSVENLSNLQRKYGKKKWFLGFWETFNQLIIVIYVSYVYLIYNILVVRKFSIGDFSAMFSAVRNVDMNLRRLMQLIPQIQNNGLYIDNFLMLMNYENKVTDGPVEIKKDALKEYSLELKNVSFRYSPNGEEVLRNVDMRIKAGEKIALVGHNGAGKTTLVKLLLRFYDPDSGELYFNGKNIKDYNLESYRNLFGTVFQDFQIYSFSAMENILMDRSCDEYRKDVKEILELIKVSVDPDNALSKEFDKEGIVLSGGQSQKIAIARALIQDSPVLILDEPSSSLDPISEYEMNQYLFELAKDKTVIFISHRLSTTVMADRIYLLENGEIIEVGSHSELLNRNGKYADMFHKQAEKYIDNRNAKDDRTC